MDYERNHNKILDTHQKTPGLQLGTDTFLLSWYSIVDQKYYLDEFLFPLDQLDAKERHFKKFNVLSYTNIREKKIYSILLSKVEFDGTQSDLEKEITNVQVSGELENIVKQQQCLISHFVTV